MIFDAILIIILIYTIRKSGEKGCTEDLNFGIGFLIIVRIAGFFYMPLSQLLNNFIKNKDLTTYGAYIIVFIITFLIYNAIIGDRIVEFGKKIPRTTGTLMTYGFAIFKTLILYSVVFSFLYTLPVLHRLPEKLIKPKTYRLTYGIIGTGTETLFAKISQDLSDLKNPIDFLQNQKRKQESGSKKQLDAVKEHEGLGDYIKEDDKKNK